MARRRIPHRHLPGIGQAIRGFAGDELLSAKHYPENHDFLLEFEPRVQHFESALPLAAGLH